MIKNEKRLQWLAFFEMFLVSIAANSLAPLITTFQEQYNLSITTSSLFPVFLSIGGISANFIGAYIISRIGVRKYNISFIVSLGITAILFYFSKSTSMLFAAVFVLGFTTGSGMAVSSTILSHLEVKLQNFGLYHACFGLGGILTPAIIGIFFKYNLDYRIVFIIIFFSAVSTAIYQISSKILPDHVYETESFVKSLSVIKLPVVYLSLIILIFYASSEMGTVLWSSNLFMQAFQFTKESSVMFLSGFWLVFTLGRIFTQQIEKKLKFKKTIFISLLFVLISLTVLLWKGWPLLFWLMALGMAPIFPTVQKYAMQHIPKSQVGLFNNLLYGFLGVGNIILPALMGVFGGINIYYAFLIPIVSMLIILVVFRFLLKA
jgi:MFS family permease